MITIDDAPFSPIEKRKIKAMGFDAWDWGHPEVKLSDPVSFFRDRLKELRRAEEKNKLPMTSKFKPGNDIPAEALFNRV